MNPIVKDEGKMHRIVIFSEDNIARACMRLDLDTITFKYDNLKSLDDSTVKDAIRHFSLLNVNAAGACGYDFPCDGGRLVRAYLRRRRGTI